jgi:hypothetical protein
MTDRKTGRTFAAATFILAGAFDAHAETSPDFAF